MRPRWIIATVAIAVMGVATAYLALVEHMTAAFVVFVLLVVLLLARVFVAYLAWLARPGHRGLRVVLAGGLLAYLHDRSSGRETCSSACCSEAQTSCWSGMKRTTPPPDDVGVGSHRSWACPR